MISLSFFLCSGLVLPREAGAPLLSARPAEIAEVPISLARPAKLPRHLQQAIGLSYDPAGQHLECHLAKLGKSFGLDQPRAPHLNAVHANVQPKGPMMPHRVSGVHMRA